MKNIHVLPTEKPSRIYLFEERLILGDLVTVVFKNSGAVNQSIYITSDEEIKVGDWYYLPRTNSVYKCNEDSTELNLERRLGIAKVILTTDEDLIKDDVQKIDDEFLEWFVKNPSCEKVVVHSELNMNGANGLDRARFIYKIIIPFEQFKNK